MTKRKVFFLPGAGASQIDQMFQLFKSDLYERTNDIEEADLVQFAGGTDVNPTLYGEYTHNSVEHSDTARDAKETQVYNRCLELGIPMVGICRGGQFLHVMNGGTMHQDVDGHNRGQHKAFVYGKMLPILVSSTHHQMMRLNPATRDRAMVLMYANESNYKLHMSSLASQMKYTVSLNIKDGGTWDEDLEVLYYPDTRCLCFQPHPEYATHRHDLTDLVNVYFSFLENYIFDMEEIENEIKES